MKEIRHEQQKNVVLGKIFFNRQGYSMQPALMFVIYIETGRRG